MRSSGPTFVALEMADQAARWWIGFHESIDDCKLILCNLISNTLSLFFLGVQGIFCLNVLGLPLKIIEVLFGM